MIEKNVPPDIKPFRTEYWKENLPNMEVGDSVLMNVDQFEADSCRVTLRQVAAELNTGMKFKTKRVDGGYRVRRIV